MKCFFNSRMVTKNVEFSAFILSINAFFYLFQKSILVWWPVQDSQSLQQQLLVTQLDVTWIIAWSDFEVYGFQGVFQKCVVFICSWVSIQRGQSFGVWMSSHKVCPRPRATSWPYKRCVLCSALPLEYEICMDHKEHMDHPSKYLLQQNHQKDH